MIYCHLPIEDAAGVNSDPIKFSELGAECMNLIHVKSTWMCAVVQFCEVGVFTVNFVIAVVSREIRNCIWPLTKLQRRYQVYVQLGKTHSKGV